MHSKKIIIAEASPTIKGVADSLLRQHGYDVVCTSDGLQAWEVIQAEHPDLALIGLNLSGISGLELCKQMSSDKSGIVIPSMLMVGAKDNLSKEQLIASGARGQLKKPFSPKDLLGAVEHLIGPGDLEKPPQSAGNKSTTRTSYNAEILSTTRSLESEPEQVHNLNWVDIEESGKIPAKSPQKVASIDIDNDDQGLIIEEDQFGLASGTFPQNTPRQAEPAQSDDEDYDWFIGEMKSEVEGVDRQAFGGSSSAASTPEPPGPGDSLQFVDLGDSGFTPAKPEDSKPASSSSKAAQKAGKEVSDAEIEKIAEKVAQKLASALLSGIDRKAIIDAIRSVL